MAAVLLIAWENYSGAEETADRCEGSGGEFLGQVKPVLYVKDVKASAAFFRDVLGFAFLNWADNEDAPYYAEMAAGAQKFGLHLPGDLGEKARVGQQRIYFRVRNVEAHRKRVLACKGRPGPIEQTAWMTMFAVTDPDGHEIVFAETDPAVHTINPW
jgi:catechol 2,3-dioxygenase-like lactoylglutathione lyase family enzyme